MRIITKITLAIALAWLTGCSKQQPPQPVRPVQPADSSTPDPKDPPQVATPDPQDQAEPKTGTDTTSTKPPQAAVTPTRKSLQPQNQAPVTAQEAAEFIALVRSKMNDGALAAMAERPGLATYGDADASVLVAAAVAGNLEIVDVLLSKYNANKTASLALLTGLMRGHVDVATKLIEHGADPNFQLEGNGPSCLHKTIRSRKAKLDAVQLLVDAGANVNIINQLAQSTPLDHAIKYKKTDIAALLRSKGAKTYKELNP